jgi:hypothetical protein
MSDRQVVALGANRNLRNGGIDKGAFEFGMRSLRGFNVLTMMGTAVSTAAAATGTGTCALRMRRSSQRWRPAERPEQVRIGAEFSFGVVGSDAKRFQKTNVLGVIGEPGNRFSFRLGFVERILVNLNAE